MREMESAPASAGYRLMCDRVRNFCLSPTFIIMVLAPPTPPPTSTTEIQDAARAEPPTTTQATQEPQPSSNTPDSYQLRFPTIVDAVSRSDYDAVTQIAEEIDLNVGKTVSLRPCEPLTVLQAVSDRQNSRLLAIAPLVLVYLIQNQT